MTQNSLPENVDIVVLTDDIRGHSGFAVNGRLVCYALADDWNVVNAAIDGRSEGTTTVRGRDIDVVPVASGRPTTPQDRSALGQQGMQRLVAESDPDVVISLIDVQMCSYLAELNRPRRASIELRQPGKDPDPQAIVENTMEGLKDLDLSKNFEWVAQVPIDGHPMPDGWESFFAEVDYPVAMSEFGTQAVESQFGTDITTIRHGVDTCEVPDTESEHFLVGTVNRNQFRKQYPRLIEAWGKFYDRAGRPDDVRFYAHCDYQDEMGWDLRRFIDRWDLAEAVIPYRGKVDREELMGLYNRFDVYTSATGGEGFGLTTIEAFSQGTPAIITDYTTSEELVADDDAPRGSLVEPALMYDEHPNFAAVPRALVDTDAFADTLLEYYQNQERCRREGENAREWVHDTLGFEHIAEQWREFIGNEVYGTEKLTPKRVRA